MSAVMLPPVTNVMQIGLRKTRFVLKIVEMDLLLIKTTNAKNVK
jgi:hypothetical protein